MGESGTRRIYAIGVAFGLMFVVAASHAQVSSGGTETFTIGVDQIIEFITSDTTNATNGTLISNWNVDDGSDSAGDQR